MTTICFASTTGGHLNGIKELIGKVNCDKFFFVTLDKKDSRSLLKNQKVFYVEDTQKNVVKTIINAFQSLMIFQRTKPDIVITLGAGSALPFCYIAKIFGKKIIFIESFARIEKPSAFGKFIYPIADLTLYQWKPLAKYYPRGIYSGSILNFNTKKYHKKKQIFVSVGLSHVPFDRLLKAIDKFAQKNKKYKIIGQIGVAKYLPKRFQYKRDFSFDEMQRLYVESEIVICHAGVGTTVNSLSAGCKTILVIREKKFAEHVDDHQAELGRTLSKKGWVIVAKDLENIEKYITSKAKTKPPISSNARLIETINQFIQKSQNQERK